MANNDIKELRSHLFNTLNALQDKDNPMDIERAKAVCLVGDVIISTAKTEIDFMRLNAAADSQFFEKLPGERKSTSTGVLTINGNVTTHKLT